MTRRLATRVTGGDAARALIRLMLLGLAMNKTPFFATQVQGAVTVDCGDPIALELEPGLWSIADAEVQDNTPIASGGPNLIKNGHFSYSADGTNQDIANTNGVLGLTTSIYSWPGQLTQTDILDWAASGGGPYSYGCWGPWFWDPSGNNYDMNVTPNILPGTSIVYFGNYVALMEGTAVVDANGFTQQSDISIYNEDPAAYGEDPNTITQVVSGLTVGKRYRLQFMEGNECCYADPGGAALSITGYQLTYFAVFTEPSYRTIDFVAKDANTAISFMSWGHVDFLAWPGTSYESTELALDDVILTQCFSPEPPPPDPTPDPTDCVNNAFATTIPTRKVMPSKTFRYSATLINPRNKTKATSSPKPVRPKKGSNVTLEGVFRGTVFSMQLPDGVTLAAASSRPKVTTTPTVNDGNVLSWDLAEVIVKAGGRIRLTLKLVAPSTCSTPDALPLTGLFGYMDDVGRQVVKVCIRQPLYVWSKGCTAIPAKTPKKAQH